MNIQELYSAFKECNGVTTDSRAVQGGEMFFALKGENFDGNEYALKALELGARYAVVDEAWAASHPVLTPAPELVEGHLIPVPDTLAALQALARHHRENTFVDGRRLTVVGLTGTNGKTTTKELITRVLSAKYRVTATQGNLNNDIGVPLSLLSIGPETELAVIEMGASHPDDIEKLVKVCEPDCGLITNVGRGHLLGFGSFDGVKAAKGKLYDYLAVDGGFIFLNTDDPVLVEMAAARKGLKVIEYGVRHSGAIIVPTDKDHLFVRIEMAGKLLETHITGAYNADNIMAAIAVGLHFGVSMEDAMRAVSEYIPTNNRSQIEKTGRNTLIVDAYNANPTSMAAALDNLAMIQAPRKAALLGNMLELGSESFDEHSKILDKTLSMGLDRICLVGDEFGKVVRARSTEAVKWFATSDDLASWLKDNPLEGAIVLVKGSRGTRMERTLPVL